MGLLSCGGPILICNLILIGIFIYSAVRAIRNRDRKFSILSVGAAVCIATFSYFYIIQSECIFME